MKDTERARQIYGNPTVLKKCVTDPKFAYVVALARAVKPPKGSEGVPKRLGDGVGVKVAGGSGADEGTFIVLVIIPAAVPS